MAYRKSSGLVSVNNRIAHRGEVAPPDLDVNVGAESTRADILQSLEAGSGLAAYSGPARTPDEMRAAVRSAFRNKTS